MADAARRRRGRAGDELFVAGQTIRGRRGGRERSSGRTGRVRVTVVGEAGPKGPAPRTGRGPAPRTGGRPAPQAAPDAGETHGQQTSDGAVARGDGGRGGHGSAPGVDWARHGER